MLLNYVSIPFVLMMLMLFVISHLDCSSSASFSCLVENGHFLIL